MVVFLTSLRHPLNSNNYTRVEQLFETSLCSVCNQTSDEFRVVAVCNQLPQIHFKDERVIYHIVDFPPPSQQSTAHIPGGARGIDKGSKLLSGALLARHFDPDYLFIFDADDLIHTGVVQYLEESPKAHGWYVDAGYTFDAATKRIQRTHGMVRYCGTTLAPNLDIILRLSGQAGALDERASRDELLRCAPPGMIQHIWGHHSYLPGFFGEHGYRMQRFTFRAAAWVLGTGENRSGTLPRRGVPVTPQFCREFGISPPDDGFTDADWLDRTGEWFSCLKSYIGSKFGSGSDAWSGRAGKAGQRSKPGFNWR